MAGKGLGQRTLDKLLSHSYHVINVIERSHMTVRFTRHLCARVLMTEQQTPANLTVEVRCPVRTVGVGILLV
jgi:hypothetical protein